MMQIYNNYLKRESFERFFFDNFTQTITLVTLIKQASKVKSDTHNNHHTMIRVL